MSQHNRLNRIRKAKKHTLRACESDNGCKQSNTRHFCTIIQKHNKTVWYNLHPSRLHKSVLSAHSSLDTIVFFGIQLYFNFRKMSIERASEWDRAKNVSSVCRWERVYGDSFEWCVDGIQTRDQMQCSYSNAPSSSLTCLVQQNKTTVRGLELCAVKNFPCDEFALWILAYLEGSQRTHTHTV